MAIYATVTKNFYTNDNIIIRAVGPVGGAVFLSTEDEYNPIDPGLEEFSIGPVNTSKSFLIVGGMNTVHTNENFYQWGWRADLKDSNTLRYVRTSGAYGQHDVSIYIVTFTSGVSVQRFLKTLPNGAQSDTETITAVDTNKSFINIIGPGSSVNAPGDPDRWNVRASFNSSSEILLYKQDSIDDVTVSVEVVEFS